MAKKKKFRNALFIGRFQPFHDGHLKVIQDIAQESEALVIVIAGPARPDRRNPFSFKERKRMVQLALRGEGIKYSIHETHDVNDDGRWNRHVKKFGRFDVAYSRNPWTARCLKALGIPVKKHRFYERYKNCGREIRKRILHGKRWDSLVPQAVYSVRQENKRRGKAENNMQIKILAAFNTLWVPFLMVIRKACILNAGAGMNMMFRTTSS